MELQIIQRKIYEIRGQRVMLDFDLAELYEVETKRLKEAVRRNIERFPDEFMFELTKEEFKILRSQIASSSWGGTRYPPFAFTEHGVAMLSGILNSPKAIDTHIAIIRAFITLRHYALTYSELSQKITELEAKFDTEIADIHEALRQLAPAEEDPNAWENRPRIGFNKP
ncbi:MAG: ORF6N domain-containing protein [Saprospiraceae bacterium]|nr:ORF6N domain-containing protein [Saprospiraceae bacterium]